VISQIKIMGAYIGKQNQHQVAQDYIVA
jgi:hypothetical protein